MKTLEIEKYKVSKRGHKGQYAVQSDKQILKESEKSSITNHKHTNTNYLSVLANHKTDSHNLTDITYTKRLHTYSFYQRS